MQIKHYTIPIFIPELACPNRCIYCDQSKISGMKKIPSINDVRQTIENHLSTIVKENAEVEIGFFGGSFTGIPIDEQKKYLQSVQIYIKQGSVNSVRLSTRPDYIDINKLKLLKDYHVKTIELGAQSLDDEVLQLSERGHSVDDVKRAAQLIIENGFDLGLQMMIGLPGDTLEKTIQTAKKIVEFGATNTRIYPTIVIKGTKLETLYLENKYKALSLSESIIAIKSIIPIFENAKIRIIRIGLHPSEDLQSDAYIAGPLNPSIRELVETELWKDQLIVYAKNPDKNKNITIFVAPKMFNFAIGYHAFNKIMLEKSYKNVKFMRDCNLNERDFYAHIN
ncbi:MAG: radical SAM protein [Bacteroidetes bacterium]|nr:radical SAM protein [Bacteroidota bacterium]